MEVGWLFKYSEAGTGHKVTISGDNKIVLKNVALGEVWICAGQSNMGWSVANSFEAEGEADVDLPICGFFVPPVSTGMSPSGEPRPFSQVEAM